MVYTIKDAGAGNLFLQIITIIVVLVIIIIVVFLFYKLIVIPISTPYAFQKVTCTTTPAIPSGIKATTTSNRVYVSWTGVSNVDSYTLYMGTKAGFGIAIAERAITTYGPSIVVINLLPKTYYFKVLAVNSCGSSALSTETSITVGSWPALFKMCKSDIPTICLLAQSNGAQARVVSTCPNQQCVFSYLNQQNLANADDSLCILENNPGGVVIEQPITSKTCTGATDWTINLSTGFISTADGLCLGADSIPESLAYNTTCSVISNPNDTRYVWTIQPI